jgi:uncharacterized protein (DUF885 family)
MRVPLLALFAVLLIVPAMTRAQASAPPSPAQVDANRKELNAIFKDYWEDQLKHNPEFASTLGDKRYNDQISDYSVKAYNEELEREQRMLLRLGAVDDAGLTDQEKINCCCASLPKTRRRRTSRSGRCP